ncbi:TPA: hypothetical protein EYG84_00515 [Candidatus Gracilibacteria bacterium]|nr:hypothetical protein [Candidatus Gracilibacteria bacterium]
MTKPKQFYWKLEEVWKKYFINNKKFDFTPSEKPVFYDDNANDTPYFGLKYDAQIIEKNEKQIFLTDNHHKVLSFLFQQFIYQKSEIIVVHIDAHRDDAIFQNYEKCSKEIEEIKNFVKNIERRDERCVREEKNEYIEKMKNYIRIIQNNCRVSDYLDIALHLGFVKEVICITQHAEFEAFEITHKNFILNLDIDIYGEEGSAVSLELKTRVIAKTWEQANSVCIATSPAFIDDDCAQKCIEIMMN